VVVAAADLDTCVDLLGRAGDGDDLVGGHAGTQVVEDDAAELPGHSGYGDHAFHGNLDAYDW